MKWILLKLLIFVGLFFAADWALGALVGHFYAQSKNVNISDVNRGFLEDANDDILVFGASELSHALISTKIEKETGLSTYNLACDACGIYYQYPLLKTLLDKHTPKAIIMSSGMMREEDFNYLSRLYPFYHKNNYVREMVDRLDPREQFKLTLQGYIYNSKIIRILDSKDDNLKGYVPLPPELSKIKDLEITTLRPGKNYEIQGDTSTYFEKFIQEAQAKGVKVYICSPPVLENVHPEYHRRVVELVEGSGASFIDFSKDAEILGNPDLFFDLTHLNHDGAEVATEKVLKVLKRDGIY